MLVNIIMLLVECVKLLLTLCGMLNYKIKKSVSGIVALSVCEIILVIKGILDFDYRISSFYFVAAVICALFIEGKRRFLFAFISFLGICSMDDMVSFVLRRMFSASKEEMRSNPILYATISIISLAILSIIAWMMQKFYYKRNEKKIGGVQSANRFYLVLFLIGMLGISLSMVPATSVVFQCNDRTECFLMFWGGTFCTMVLTMGFLLIYNSNAKKHYRSVAEVNRRLLASQEQYYQMLLEKESETRMFRHDITNHIMCVDALLEAGEYEEAKKYLGELKSSIRELKVKYQTGNRLVNVIINDIVVRYEMVHLTWTGELPLQMKLSNTDVCVIFSNVLENAFHAASECTEQREVSVEIKGVGNSLVIVVCNDLVKPVIERKGIFATYKLDKRNHGYGIINVKNCVRANGGSVEYSYTEKNFRTEIVLLNAISS